MYSIYISIPSML